MSKIQHHTPAVFYDEIDDNSRGSEARHHKEGKIGLKVLKKRS